MAAAEEWLCGRGVPKLNLMVRATNHAVVGFYEALGYEREERVVLARRLDGARHVR
jgi:ribosomal protein S18 acetylase RimI-like enzyme